MLALVTDLGLRTRRGLILNPQSFALILRNRLYTGVCRESRVGLFYPKGVAFDGIRFNRTAATDHLSGT